MVVVAIIGASSGLGLSFIRTAARDVDAMKKHHLVLISRSPQPQWQSKGFTVRQVDYASGASLADALQGVHTVLSFVGQVLDTDPQLALIEAAREAGVTRFAPSEYAGDGPYDAIDAYKHKAVVRKAAKDAGLQVTQFNCGLFLSLLATGTPKPVTIIGREDGVESGEEEALAGLRPWNFVLNMKGGTADLVRDGSAKMTLTDTRDIARFVLASLDLPEWPEKLGMSGCVSSYKEIVAYVEKVQGRKFLIRENSIAELQALADSNPQARFYNQVRIAIDDGWALVNPDLNKAFPHIKPVTMEEFVDKWWMDVKLPAASWSEDKTFTVGQ
ncbi:hypothetical protein AMS68_001716 [Peltaster fructicola]|uniref:NmrA-like domain-containing protein n=1 Tax=Peltaster fructicola TaxID=286661 RepID=A0A6H0XNJ5_9PEZI|nr:hypothetical protein AMS68_001716 [Peltaster fructicola]